MKTTNIIGIVLFKNPASPLIDVLVALSGIAHGQGGVHVHVVTSEVQGNQTLEEDGPPWEGGS